MELKKNKETLLQATGYLVGFILSAAKNLMGPFASLSATISPLYTVAVVLLLLAGCNAPPEKLAHVRTVTVSHVIVFKKANLRLDKSEMQSLDAFMQSVRASAVSYVGIETDDRNRRQLARAKRVKTWLVSKGVASDTIHLQPVATGNAKAMLLTVQYAVAVPPEPCPDWSKNALTNYNNTRFSNFGCASNNNLVVELSNPADLEGGHGKPGISDTRDDAAVQKYMTNVSQPMATASTGGSGGSASSASSAGPASSTANP